MTSLQTEEQLFTTPLGTALGNKVSLIDVDEVICKDLTVTDTANISGNLTIPTAYGVTPSGTTQYMIINTLGELGSTVVSGVGDVTGPAGATDSAVVLFNGTTGKLVKNSTATVSGGGQLTINSVNLLTGGIIYINGNRFLHNIGGGSANTFVGQNAGNLTNTGNNNSGYGTNALLLLTNGSGNTALGSNSLSANTSGSNNSAYGNQTLVNVTTGSTNTVFGNGAGSNLTLNDSNNVCIANAGTAGDNNTIYLGDNTTHTRLFAGGVVNGVTPTPVGSLPLVIAPSGLVTRTTTASRISFSGTALLDGSNAILLGGLQLTSTFLGTNIAGQTFSLDTFRFVFNRALTVGESINCRLFKNGGPFAFLGKGAWGLTFNSTTPVSGTSDPFSVGFGPGDQWYILVNSFAASSNNYLSWTMTGNLSYT